LFWVFYFVYFLCIKDGEIIGCILNGYDADRSFLTILSLSIFTKDPLCTGKLLLALGHYAVDNLPEGLVAVFREAEDFKTALAVRLLTDASKLKDAGNVLHGVKVL